MIKGGRPLLLDLFCGAGGAGAGYNRAGFEVVGVDINPQPHYPFEFHQGDALEYLRRHGHEFDAVHSSPPCQRFSPLGRLHAKAGYQDKHPDLIGAVRDALRALGKPYVIENVVGAPLIDPVMLCGSFFWELRVYRHRLFEASFPLRQPEHKPHGDKTPSAGRGKSPKGYVTVSGTGGVIGVPYQYLCWAMGIHWMKKPELSQSIPPAYTHYIGTQLLPHVTPSPDAP